MVSVGRNAAWIVFDDESEPRLASLRRSGGKRVMVVPGDLIEARALDEERVVIDRMLARTSELERYKASGTTIMAANVDAIAIVSALVDPPLRFEMIDRLIAFAELRDLRSIVVLTKIDLAPPLAGDSVCALYGGLGYTAIPLNPKSGVGIPDLRAQIETHRVLLVGQSGVGKSSIFRALGGISVVGDVSRFGRGRQTTTAARLFRLGSGFLIDSPGIGEFELDTLPPRELAYGFAEFRAPGERCRFTDCAHLEEPGCAVRAAVDAGTIAASRYASYRAILQR